MRRSLSAITLALGLILLLGAGLIRWVFAPGLAVLPSDLNTTRTYSGTAASLLNPAALTGGTGQLFLSNVPITVTHHAKVLGTKGDNALVSDARSVAAGGKTVAAVDYRYAVNRTTLQRGSGYSGVVRQTGITFNWPIRTQKHDYTGWVADTQSTVRLHYTGTATRGGVSTYVFTDSTQPRPITDPQVLKGLPQALPKATLVQLVGGLPLTAAQQALFRNALPSLPDPVPFAYTYQVKATYWVEPRSGIVVDLNKTEIRSAGLAVGAVTAPIAPVMSINYTSPAATLAAAAKDARDNGGSVSMLYIWLPFGLGLAGGIVALLGVGAFVVGPRRRPITGPTAPRQPTPVR